MSFNDDPSKDSLDWDGRVRGTNKGCLKASDHNWYTPQMYHPSATFNGDEYGHMKTNKNKNKFFYKICMKLFRIWLYENK